MQASSHQIYHCYSCNHYLNAIIKVNPEYNSSNSSSITKCLEHTQSKTNCKRNLRIRICCFFCRWCLLGYRLMKCRSYVSGSHSGLLSNSITLLTIACLTRIIMSRSVQSSRLMIRIFKLSKLFYGRFRFNWRMVRDSRGRIWLCWWQSISRLDL